MPRLADALAIVREAPRGPTVLMLDAKDGAPWSSETVERLAALIAPVRERVYVGTPADWNLRRLRAVDPDVALTFDPQYYLEAKGSDSPPSFNAISLAAITDNPAEGFTGVASRKAARLSKMN